LPPRTAGAGFANVSDLRAAYKAVLPRIQAIKKKRWRNDAARRLAFHEALPGVPTDRLATYATRKASAIALDYIAWEYKLRVKGDALKRHLAVTPEAMIQRFRASLRYGPPPPLLEKLALALECPTPLPWGKNCTSSLPPELRRQEVK
jgi:hypothetical protein